MTPLVHRVLGSLNRIPIGERAVRIGPDRLYADSLDRWVAAVAWSRGWLAGPERRLVERTVRAGMVAVDVGANIGFHTLVLARAVGPTGRVHAIEPAPANFRLLERAVREAGLAQVVLHRAVAADVAGERPLYLAADNRGDHRLVPADEPRAHVVVPSLVLDEVLADTPHVDFVKIDVQGAEVAVLRGLAATLARHRDVRLLCELSPDLLERAGADAERFFGPLRALGLRPHRLGPTGEPEPVTEAGAWARARAAGYETLYLARV